MREFGRCRPKTRRCVICGHNRPRRDVDYHAANGQQLQSARDSRRHGGGRSPGIPDPRIPGPLDHHAVRRWSFATTPDRQCHERPLGNDKAGKLLHPWWRSVHDRGVPGFADLPDHMVIPELNNLRRMYRIDESLVKAGFKAAPGAIVSAAVIQARTATGGRAGVVGLSGIGPWGPKARLDPLPAQASTAPPTSSPTTRIISLLRVTRS